jgi:hypothetical protein
MRACARVALISMVVSASFGLAGCGPVDDLKESVSRWFDIGKLPSPRAAAVPDDLPAATRVLPPEKMPAEEASQAPKKSTKKAKPARKPHRPQTVEPAKKPPISDSPEAARPQGTEAAKPQGTEAQSPPAQPEKPRLRTLWPDAPASGTFSR